ncbi:MAG: hypothetical protein R2798_08855 [Chitinophagales bacterium]|nr:hypothetical protein [Bacteroidota bacterium]MCB9043937.1 hypothetical protein [Chitinophagales bacterium]
MKHDLSQVNIGQGLGAVKFGISPDDLKKILGEPDDIDFFSYDEIDEFFEGDEEDYEESEGDSESWHYDDIDASFTFELGDGDWRLISIASSDAELAFLGETLMGTSMQEIAKFVEKTDLGSYVIEDYSNEDFPNHKLMYFDAKSLYLWFLDEQLSEIQWGVLWKDEETPLWPPA